MVIVPSGTFMMGSPEDEPERNNNEGPQHEVTIPKPFAIGRCAVTRGQFAAFVAGTGHKTDWRGGYITAAVVCGRAILPSHGAIRASRKTTAIPLSV